MSPSGAFFPTRTKSPRPADIASSKWWSDVDGVSLCGDRRHHRPQCGRAVGSGRGFSRRFKQGWKAEDRNGCRVSTRF